MTQHGGEAGPPGFDLGIPSIGPAYEIGRGAAGVVYRAEQPAFNRTVAVKLLPFAALDEAARARFERECRAMGSVSGHPGIVTVYEAGFTPSGQPYILMELMDGGSLERRLEMRGPFRWEEVVEIGLRLADALEVAHRKGILHRDIKPDNVLVSTYGDAKLADFSISRIAGATKTQTGLVAATPAHAPPEVLRGEEPSARGDVYSLASTLWALLAGGPAFVRPHETTIFPLLRRVEEEPVPDLRPRGVPDPVCRVLERAMAKDPTLRPPTANAFGAELIAARDQSRAWHGAGTPPVIGAPYAPAPPPPAAPAPMPPPPQPHGPPRQTLLIIGGAIAAAAIVAVVLLLTVGKGGGGSPTGNQTPGASAPAGISTDTGSSPPGGATGIATNLLSAGDVGSDYTDSTSAQSKLSDFKPCNQDVPLGAKTDEADIGWSNPAQEFVSHSVAAFQPGQAQQYLTDFASAAKCGHYTETASGVTLNETIAARDGPQIGDQTLRYEVVGASDIGLSVGLEVILMRKGDLVAVVSVVNPNSPDTSTAEAVAAKAGAKLGG